MVITRHSWWLLFGLAAICSKAEEPVEEGNGEKPAAGEVMRVCQVSPEAGPGVVKMTLEYDGKTEKLFVSKEPVVTERDVKKAWVDFARRGIINVELNEGGGRKLSAVTAEMEKGVDRLALIVEGALLAAPVVQDTLGSRFILQGLKKNAKELEELAARIMGDRKPIEEDPEAFVPPPAPKGKWVEVTEEEYQANKAFREQLGIFHLERVFTEEELDEKLKEGMTPEQVIELFGRPYLGADETAQEEFSFTYEVAPERRSEPVEGEDPAPLVGFNVKFLEGKLKWWGGIWSTGGSEKKWVPDDPGPPPTLVVEMPELDFSKEIPSLIELFEKIEVPNPTQEVNRTDLVDLLGLAQMPWGPFGDPEARDDPISIECDLMKTLAHNFPEVRELCASATGSTVTAESLALAVRPYAEGRRDLPLQERKGPAPKGAKKKE